MEIKQARFVISNSDYRKCPSPNMPEYAFIGRSNVGKSSLINMLTNDTTLAKTSGKPGKTQLINHFIINGSWYLVDLPGYGYATTSKTDRKKFEKLFTDYILNRENLYCLFVLVDIRHEPMAKDLEFLGWLGLSGIPFALIFTKADKLKPEEVTENIERYKTRMLEDWEEMPACFISSAKEYTGRNEILAYIDSINKKG
jgi:GTP-binding protein